MGQTSEGKRVVRLRAEGHGVVMAIPQRVRDELCFRAGDILVLTTEGGALVARKVDLSHVAAPPASTPSGGE